ncbi:MAG: hypothetical protein RL701_2148 [Pseudomonadota bacterium]|jgi:predicted RNA-binding Zn-ribbon protein involved in translation (DUF1610 family)
MPAEEPERCTECGETLEDCETGGEFRMPSCQYGKNRVKQRKQFEKQRQKVRGEKSKLPDF